MPLKRIPPGSRIAPRFLAVAQHGVEDAALAVEMRPRDRIGRALVGRVPAGGRPVGAVGIGVVHVAGVQHEQHVQIGREIRHRIPLLLPLEAVAVRLAKPRKLRVDHAHAAHLLRAVDDQFPAEHLRVGIGLVTELAVAPGAELLRVGVHGFASVKRVGGRVGADETLAALDCVEERLLTGRRHRRLAVGAPGQQVAARVEHERVELREILRAEKAAVLGEGELDVVRRPERLQHLRGEVQAAVAFLGDVVLEVGRLGEEQDFLRLRLLGARR